MKANINGVWKDDANSGGGGLTVVEDIGGDPSSGMSVTGTSAGVEFTTNQIVQQGDIVIAFWSNSSDILLRTSIQVVSYSFQFGKKFSLYTPNYPSGIVRCRYIILRGGGNFYPPSFFCYHPYERMVA